MSALRTMTVAGTRPELIRLSLLVPLLDDATDHTFVHTGQNTGPDLHDQFLDELAIRDPDVQLALPAGSAAERVAAVLTQVDALLAEVAPQRLVILGDTDSGMCAYAAARRGIPVVHLEAGNRAHDPRVPEEINRRVIDDLSTVLLPYTESSAGNLRREGVADDRIVVIGNPIVEVLAAHRLAIRARRCAARLGLPARFVLATVHRAETTDDPAVLRSVVAALAAVGASLDAPVVLPLHPRTAQRLAAADVTLDADRFVTTRPLGFVDFVSLEGDATLVLTDSGTVQEETAVLGIPTVLVRDVTERPELLACGAVVLGGRTTASIGAAVEQVLRDGPSGELPAEYAIADVAARAAAVVVDDRWGGAPT
ncbi:MAG: UDP-N-acetylglucosamine 2-epimerase (non-hydrolyzing) [Acidimicrobiales bacterium]|nr:UDP-N-acetylglucosamine 2-epimerase (non-hydrolyzing) [Acidimicrobiales bacterium]MCB1260282.1 UDP-N-acetylglucosamine 2-epimerase (non-hydrolyzing) [Acidimicrobiales bacterium]